MRANFLLPKRFIKMLGACLFLLYAVAGNAQTAKISGKIPNASGLAIVITGTVNDVVFTNEQGEYFANLPLGGSYNLKPYSNRYLLDGVSTYDAVLIALHIDNPPSLDNPYKIIAADIDHSNSINSADTFYLRRAILGIIEDFPNNTSWRFVRSDYVFPDPTNPFLEPFPESFTVNNLSADIADVDYVPIKVGDVNNTAILTDILLTDDIFLSRVKGRAVIDANQNCLNDNGEAPLEGWLVTAESALSTYTTTTDADGKYSFTIPPGNYLVTIHEPNNLWAPCISAANSLNLGIGDSVGLNLPVKPVYECPLMSVDLSAPFMRRCFDNFYTVQYCNQGTVEAQNAFVDVTLDPYLSYVSSSIPWTAVNGNTYTFPVGDVAAGDCGRFSLVANLSCDATLGQTHCSTATVYPDTICQEVPGWNGGDLEIRGRCENDQVVFTVKNKGADMTETVDYVVFEDIMIQMTGNSIKLNHNQTDEITIPANGATWRMEVEQPLNHPFARFVSAAVEGCGTNGSGGASQGFVTQFPLGDESPFVDEDCQENIGSFDPNDKQGFPRGVGTEFRIPKNTEMEYMIRFQNTGTDTAFTVMVLDTLPAVLDIYTVRPGVSSHPYKFNILGNNVLQFVFSNIQLPDSNINEAASHGYLKFAVKQLHDLPDGTTIENQAGIYFDFNKPVITNRTLHTVGDIYLNVSTVSFKPGVKLDVYPNPASSKATFVIEDVRSGNGTLQLFSAQGRLVQKQAFNSNVFDLNADTIEPGLYFFRIERDGAVLGSGKLVISK